MTKPFDISFEPLPKDNGSELERATLARVAVWVDGRPITRLADELSHTVRDFAQVSILHLAMWFVENWWRLRWEPDVQPPSSSWRMSHSLAAAGGGYLWPQIVFSSEGDYMRVRVRPTPDHSKDHIRYLTNTDAVFQINDFENAVGEFIDGVLARTSDLGLAASDLNAVWQIVQAERHDPVEADRRKLEALLGCDPDEAPDPLLTLLQSSEAEFGRDSMGEVAAEAGPDRIESVLGAMKAHLDDADDFVGIPGLESLREYLHALPDAALPWQRAEQLAARARETWSLDRGPLHSRTLFDILGSDRVLEERALPFAAGVRRTDNPERVAVSCRSRFAVGRRFELARLIADQIAAAPEDKMLPATFSRTGRQKFQRAFASELLCPHHELREEFGNKVPDNDDIETVAEKFDVSPLLVRTSLVNKGDLPRDSLMS